jgi:N-acetylmuramoyl-L-alanine amidase
MLAALFAFGLTLPVPHLGRGYVVRIVLPDPAALDDLPAIEGPQDASRPLVVIDAGHGGHDPGAIAHGVREKTIALAYARALKNAILSQGGVRVAMTRADDRFLVLEERAQIARALGADLFISIHADSAAAAQARGATIYTLSDEASDAEAAAFAARENRSGTVNGVPMDQTDAAVGNILFDLSQRRTAGASDAFARLIVREGQGKVAFHQAPLRSAELAVLKAPDMPAVLFEMGYITNEAEARRLAAPETQAAFADATARAIRVQFARQSGAAQATLAN